MLLFNLTVPFCFCGTMTFYFYALFLFIPFLLRQNDALRIFAAVFLSGIMEEPNRESPLIDMVMTW